MKQLESLEAYFAKTFKDVPHLPKGLTDWLVENAWWLVLIGVIIGVFGAFTALTLMLGGSILVGAYYGAAAGAVFGGIVLITALITMAVSIVTVVLEAMAIKPLQNKQKRGWDLLFLSLLISFAGAVIAALISLNIAGLFGPIIGLLIGLYVLFELRGHYLAKSNAPKA